MIVLVAGAIVIGLIFAVLLNVFLTHQPEHLVLDNSDPNYTYLQSTFPHIKLLVSKHSDSYEAKLTRAIGIYQAELVAWLEVNVAPDMKVLLLPNQDAGVNLFGMALGYCLRQGRLDILITSNDYLELTQRNIDKMQTAHTLTMPITVLSSASAIAKDYDLVLVEHNSLKSEYELTRFPQIVITSKDKDQEQNDIGGDILGNYHRFQIVQGVLDDALNDLGKYTGYAIKEEIKEVKTGIRSFLLQKNQDKRLNLCPEAQPEFQSNSHLRTLVEFFRNKTSPTIFYGLPTDTTFQLLKESGKATVVEVTPNSLEATVMNASSTENSYLVLGHDLALKMNSNFQGTLVVLVSGPAKASEVMAKFSTTEASLLPPYTNDGCFYPPRLLPASTASPSAPHFLLFPNPNP
jgi:hypothetical protein